MKKIALIIVLCLPIVLLAQSGEIVNDNVTVTDKIHKGDLPKFSQERFKAEIPYIDTSNLKPVQLDMIVKNVNKDQIRLPMRKQTYIDANLKQIKLDVLNSCKTKIKVARAFLEKN